MEGVHDTFNEERGKKQGSREDRREIGKEGRRTVQSNND